MKSKLLLLLPLIAWFGCSGSDDDPDGNKSGALSSVSPSAGGAAGAGSGGAGGSASAGGGGSGQGGSQAGTGAAAGASGGSAVATSCETAPVQSLEPCSDCVPFEGSYVDLVKKCKIKGIVGCFSTAVPTGGEMPDCQGVMRGGNLVGCLCRTSSMGIPPGSGLVNVENVTQVCLMQETLPTCE